MPHSSFTEFQLSYSLKSLRVPANVALDSRVPKRLSLFIFDSLLVVSVEGPIL